MILHEGSGERASLSLIILDYQGVKQKKPEKEPIIGLFGFLVCVPRGRLAI
jgi:hypothetical protein